MNGKPILAPIKYKVKLERRIYGTIEFFVF